MKRILFVCTGNVFRSMSAEFLLRNQLGENSGYAVSSAGTHGRIKFLRPDVLAALKSHGVDAAGHIPRRLDAEILKDQDLVITMGTDHREFLSAHFNRRSLLFHQACHDEERHFPDLWEVVTDYKGDPDAAQRYVEEAISLIASSTALLHKRLPELLVSPR